ncbi:MAG: hypothetical protein Q9207_004286 [Kuettlingeria erythrocarpa]
MNILLEAGADPSRCLKTIYGSYTALFLSLKLYREPLAVRLLEAGARMDEKCLALLEDSHQDGSSHQYVATIMDHVKKENVQWEHQHRVLLLRLAVGKTQAFATPDNVGRENEIGQLQPIGQGPLLRAAANLGQVEVVSRFLKVPTIDVQAAEEASGLTALHYATWSNHYEIAKLLLGHAAQPSATDDQGRTAIHYSILVSSFDCLELFLKEGFGDVPPDKNGESLWHIAARRNKRGLEILGRYLTPIPPLSERRNRAGLSPLLCAARFGSSENVDWLLQAGCCNVMDAASDGSTALELLAPCSSPTYTSVARVLLDNGYDVNSDIGVRSPFLTAAENGNIHLINLLISRGADLKAEDNDGRNVVHFACNGGALHVLRFLRHKDVDWNKRGSCWINDEWMTSVSPLHLAAKLPEPNVLEYLLDEGLICDINAVTDGSVTALYIAIWSSCPKTVSTLLSRHADATIKSANGELPIEIAARFGEGDVIAAFLQHDHREAVLNDQGLKCEILAFKGGHRKAARMFKQFNMERGWMVSLSGASLWLQSSTNTFVDLPVGWFTSQQLWRPSNDIQIKWASEKASPLHIAALRGHLLIAKFLLERGANPNITDYSYHTPLHLAMTSDSADTAEETAMVELLLDHGANFYAVDASLRTPCMIAASAGRLGPLRILTARGANLSMQNHYQATALHFVAANSHSLSVLQFLITHGLQDDIGREDTEGNSPLSLILSRGNRHELLFIFSLAPSPEAYTAHADNLLVACLENPLMTKYLLRKFLRRMSKPVVSTLLVHRSRLMGTPLYAACILTSSSQQEDIIAILLEAGADLEHEGGDHGTPLMGACAAGRLVAVKLLVSKGAKFCYEKDGETISALDKAKHFPEIVRWLLVERFTEGPRRIQESLRTYEIDAFARQG